MKLFRFLLFLLIPIALPSCAVDESDQFTFDIMGNLGADSNAHVYVGQLSDATFFIYLRPMTEGGENVLSIADCEQWNMSGNDQDQLLANFTVTRKSDGAEMTLNPDQIYCREPIAGEDYFDSTDFPMLHVAWIDMDLRSGKNRPQSYTEEYDVRLTLTRNGYHDVHHILVTVRVGGHSYAFNSNYPDGSFCAGPFLATVVVDRKIYQ